MSFHGCKAMKKEYIHAVVLDLDGLMVDSETIALEMWREFLALFEKELSDAEYHQMIGMEPRETAVFVRQRTGIPLGVEEILEDHRGRVMEAIGKEMKPVDGLESFIREVKLRSLPIGVASNSSANYVERLLNAIGLRESFHCVITSDQVAHAKPAPDVYQAAAALLKTPAERCLAIEDTPIGMTSALSAGMRCVVIPNHHLDGADFSGAFAIFDSFHALLREFDLILQ
jgi:putative hydrolase of the HAD superfamily